MYKQFFLKTNYQRNKANVNDNRFISVYFVDGFYKYVFGIKKSRTNKTPCVKTTFFVIFSGTTQLTWVPVVALLMYVVTSMIGLLPIPWTMTAELFPIEIRGVAHSIAYSIANLLMFASVQSYVSLVHIFNGIHGVQWFFAVVALAGLVYALIFLPETHGKKLKEIENYFLHNTIYFGSNKTTAGENKTQTKKSTVLKPIVKNTRVTDKDYVKATNGANEKMINEV